MSTTNATTRKPLGGKSYGSIAHLPDSRMGPGDHHCHEGQARICTVKARDRHDYIQVQEKLDGSNVAVANIDGVLWPLTRAGYHANTSPYEQHYLFAGWVMQNYERFMEILQPGERLCGEWLAMAHGTRYELCHEPFVAFDIIREGKRVPRVEFENRVVRKFVMPHVVASGAISVEMAMSLLGEFGAHGASDPVEGVVYRVERKGVFDFAAKFVRPDKKDGCYLPEVSGNPAVWNWRPKK